MKVLIADKIGEPGLVLLGKRGYDVVFRPDITAQELPAAVASVSALAVRGRTKVTKAVIDAAKNLKVIARSGTGVDNIDRVAAAKRGIVVVNAPGANAESVAEHVIAFMLVLARGLVPIINQLKKGEWRKSAFTATELKGKTLGIVGFGHVGSRVAELALAFGMELLVYTRSKVPGHKLSTLPDLLKASDFISLHVPLTEETRGLIGKREFAMMKKSAYLINTARGAVIDEQSLVDALTRKAIAGVALDVYTVEPLPPDNPLHGLDNAILTPHVGADSREAEDRASISVAQDIDRVLTGGKPVHPVSL